jgi:pilus assembly protein Flp/PilA
MRRVVHESSGVHSMMKFIRKLLRNEDGPTAIEYGLIAALIAVVTIAGLTTLGTRLNTTYGNIAKNVGGSVGTGA